MYGLVNRQANRVPRYGRRHGEAATSPRARPVPPGHGADDLQPDQHEQRRVEQEVANDHDGLHLLPGRAGNNRGEARLTHRPLTTTASTPETSTDSASR